MNGSMTHLLNQMSEAVTVLVASAAPALTAIRTGPNRYVTGFLWREDLIITSDQALPAAPAYSIVLASGALTAGRPGARDPVHDLAAVWLESPVAAGLPEPARSTAIGSLVVALGTDFDGSPTARMTMVHAFPRTPGAGQEMAMITLDLTGNRVSPGGVVLDAEGRLLGMISIAAGGDGIVVPHGVVARFAEMAAATAGTGPPGTRSPPRDSVPAQGVPPPMPGPPSFPAMQPIPQVSVTAPRVEDGMHAAARNGHPGDGQHASGGPRGWLGVSLQPITVPDGLVSRAGQHTARQVVGITRGGPADRAGLRSGDVLLALDGTSTTGPNTLRAYLAPERIGNQVEVRLMRDGVIHTATLIIAAQPAG